MIGILNIEKEIKNSLKKYFDIFDFDEGKIIPDINGMIIEWVSKESNIWAKQGTLVDHYVKKKIPIIIFDKKFNILRKEYDWLKKFRVFFFEPAINNRRGFSYLPQHIKIEDENESKERSIDLGFKYNDINKIIKPFEKYFVDFSKLYPLYKTIYDTNLIDQDKNKKYSEYVKKGEFDFKDVNFTITIDTVYNSKIGYIDTNIANAISNNCIPLITKEHKYFYGFLKECVVSNIKEMDLFISTLKRIRYVMISDVKENIKKLYPEFLLENVVDVLKNCLGE